ncbi:MAG: hypothetical protein MI861_04640 [Pirellulales bacterium]|nr:hypothetical protein [Pirellulales bacterium]
MSIANPNGHSDERRSGRQKEDMTVGCEASRIDRARIELTWRDDLDPAAHQYAAGLGDKILIDAVVRVDAGKHRE